MPNEYFNFTHPYGQWKDTGIRLEGEAVRSLTVTFLEMWNAVSDKDKNDSDFTKFLLRQIIRQSRRDLSSPMQTVLWIMSR